MPDKNIIISQMDKIVTVDVNDNITGLNTSGYTSNLGPVSGVTITGGTNGQVLSTNGSGTLSWTTPSSGGGGLSGPAFFATVSNGTINVTNTPTNIPANTAALNVGGCYNTTTYRFTPTTAGYYQIGASMKNTTNQTFSNFFCMIYKNGTLYKFLEARSVSSSAMGEVGFATQSMVPMNGTTDYLEIKVSGSPANGTGVMSTIFVEGTYLRGLT